MKKILITLLILIVVAVVGYFSYEYFFSEDVDNITNTEGTQGRRSFNPFGLFGVNDTDTNQIDDASFNIDTGFTDSALPLKRLLLIAPDPVAGVTSGVRDGEEIFRYVDRATSHITDFYSTSSKVMRVTNTTIPRIQEALWGSLDTLALRYLDDDRQSIVTFVGNISDASSTSTESVGDIFGTFFPLNIQQLTFNSSGTQILYLLQNDTGSTGIISNLDNLNKEAVLVSSLREWIVEWGRQQTATLTTKPSANVAGHMFLLNTNSETQTRLIKDVKALTTQTSPGAINVAYSGSKDGFVLHTLNTETRSVIDAPFSTFPEKCVWGVENIYCAVPQTISSNQPDAWYRGENSFSDSLWKMSIETGFSEFIFNPQALGELSMDMTKLVLVPSENSVAFVNKKDGSLWSYLLVPDQIVEEEGSVEGDSGDLTE